MSIPSAIVNTAATAVVLGAPWLRSMGLSFQLVNNPAVRALGLAAVAGAAQLGAFPALLTLLAVFTLLTERSHEVLTTVAPVSSTVDWSAPAPVDLAEPHSTTPTQSYIQQEDAEEDEVHFGDSNPRLEPGPNSVDAPSFFKQLGQS